MCNSLVWTCSITGRPGLTYQEALDSEERARKRLADFPNTLQKPILYLSLLTHRSRVNDLNDDVFVFARDRFFIGETVEVHMGSEKYVHAWLSHLQWRDGFSDILIEKLAYFKMYSRSFVFQHLRKMVLSPHNSVSMCIQTFHIYFVNGLMRLHFCISERLQNSEGNPTSKTKQYYKWNGSFR